MSSFNQGVPGPATLINSSSTLLYGNTTSGTALTVQQLGAGAVMNVATSTGSSALFVSSTGQVGVGTTNPSAQLHLNGPGQATATAFSTTGLLGGSIILQDSGASAYNGGAVVFGASQGYFAAIKGSIQDGTTNTKGDLYFATRNAIADTTLATRMTITSAGNLGIGLTNPSQLLHVYGGQALIDNGTSNTAVQVDRLVFKGSSNFYVLNGSSTGVVLVSGATAWAAQSDARLKNIIEPISNALAKVETLNPVLYSWKSDETNEAHPGLIAQDVLKVQPEAVSEGVDGMMSVRYTELVPLAFAAIKDLSALVQTQQTTIDALTTRLAALEGTIGSRV